MKISKEGEALAFQEPLVCVRIHGKNFHDENRKMFLKNIKVGFLANLMMRSLKEIEYFF